MQHVLQTKYGMITLGVIPVDGRLTRMKETHHEKLRKPVIIEKHIDRVKKAKDLFSKVGKIHPSTLHVYVVN